MAKGEQRGNKEAKKPKSDKPKSGGSAYKQSQGKGGQSLIPPGKKLTERASAVSLAGALEPSSRPPVQARGEATRRSRTAAAASSLHRARSRSR